MFFKFRQPQPEQITLQSKTSERTPSRGLDTQPQQPPQQPQLLESPVKGSKARRAFEIAFIVLLVFILIFVVIWLCVGWGTT